MTSATAHHILSRSGGMVDTPDSKSCELYARDGSSPSCGTNEKAPSWGFFIIVRPSTLNPHVISNFVSIYILNVLLTQFLHSLTLNVECNISAHYLYFYSG